MVIILFDVINNVYLAFIITFIQMFNIRENCNRVTMLFNMYNVQFVQFDIL